MVGNAPQHRILDAVPVQGVEPVGPVEDGFDDEAVGVHAGEERAVDDAVFGERLRVGVEQGLDRLVRGDGP